MLALQMGGGVVIPVDGDKLALDASVGFRTIFAGVDNVFLETKNGRSPIILMFLALA